MQPAAVWLTSNAVLRLRLKEIKGCCCSIWHREVLAMSVRMWWSHSPHFSIKGCLDMPTLPPDQGWNVPERGNNLIGYPAVLTSLPEQIDNPITKLPLSTKYSNKLCFCYGWTGSTDLCSPTSDETDRLLMLSYQHQKRPKTQTFLHMETLHARMLLADYTAALRPCEAGTACCQPTKLTFKTCQVS